MLRPLLVAAESLLDLINGQGKRSSGSQKTRRGDNSRSGILPDEELAARMQARLTYGKRQLAATLVE